MTFDFPLLEPTSDSQFVERPPLTDLNSARQFTAACHQLRRSKRHTKDRGNVLNENALRFLTVVISIWTFHSISILDFLIAQALELAV